MIVLPHITNHKVHPVFEKLHPAIRSALAKHNFTEPTEPQIKAIPAVLDGENILLITPTGSVALPGFHHILRKEEKKKDLRTIYNSAPCAELGLLLRLKWCCEELGVVVHVRHGATTQYERCKQARNPPYFLITTPKTLQNLRIGLRLRRGSFVNSW